MTANVSTCLCYQCMNARPKDDATCPYCGYDNAAYRSHPLFLKPETRLQEQYVLGRVLGQGGFGITYTGLDKYLCKRVAIKEFLPSNLATRAPDSDDIVPLEGQQQAFSQSLGRFINEARYLAKFEHPNIVRVLNYFESNYTGYMVMEYLDGTPSLTWLRAHGGHLAPSAAMDIVRSLLDALEIIHSENIYHLDISAQNVFIDAQGAPILFDFGAARQVAGDYTHTLALVLKRGYSPLEQYADRGHIGAWTDIYACAALLYLLLTGRLPPPAPERFHIDTLIAPQRFAHLNIAPAFSAVVCKALAVKIEDRFCDVQSFRAALEAALIAPPSPPWITPQRMLGVLALIIVLVVFVVGLAQRPAKLAAPLAVPKVSVVSPIDTPTPHAEDHERTATIPQTEIAEPIEQAVIVQTLPTLAESSPESQQAKHVAELLVRAENQLTALKLTTPEQDNAYASYQEVLSIYPNHEQARLGLRRIADAYARLARQQDTVEEKKYFINKGLSVYPEHLELQRLQTSLLTPDSPLTPPPATHEEPVPAIPNITELLKQAQTAYQDADWERAVAIYQSILILHANHAQAQAGLRKIANAYLQRAQHHELRGALLDALWQVSKGLSAAPNSVDLLALQRELEQRLASPPPSTSLPPSDTVTKEPVNGSTLPITPSF